MTPLDQVREALEACATELEGVPNPYNPNGRYALATRCRAALSLLPSLTEVARVWDAESIKDAPEGRYYRRLSPHFWWGSFTVERDNCTLGLGASAQFFGPVPTLPTDTEQERPAPTDRGKG